MTRLCSPWDYSQRDDLPADGFAQFFPALSPIDNKEMDDMLVQCNKNSVYVLNSSYRYRDFDMIELFGSPAGRALTVNNRTATEMRPCSKPSNSSTNSQPHISSNGSASQSRPLISQQPLLYHPLQNCGYSGTCSTIGSSPSSHSTTTTASNKFVETSDLIRYRNNHLHQPNPNPTATNYSNTNSSRTNSKIAKIWKLFDEDRIRNKGTTTAHSTNNGNGNSNCTGISGSDIFSRCQSRRKSNTAQSEEKSTKDLFNEAAQLLGIKCTLSDSCRCIDCQSQYFDCDDFDSYSEYSDKSYDPEDSYVVNQAYFAAGANGDDEDVGSHQDLSGVIVCQSQQSDVPPPNPNAVPGGGTNDHANQDHSPAGANVKFVTGDGENVDDNGNNKSNQYSPHDVIRDEYEAGGPEQQIRLMATTMALAEDDSAILARDYPGRGTAGINEPEVNDNLIA